MIEGMFIGILVVLGFAVFSLGGALVAASEEAQGVLIFIGVIGFILMIAFFSSQGA